MNYSGSRRFFSSWAIVLFLALFVPSNTLEIRGLQVINDETGTFSGLLGFPRNFSSEQVHVKPYFLIDADPLSFLCSTSQRSPFQQTPWPRLKATPGSTICPHYVLDTLPTRDLMDRGFIRWYGSSCDNGTDHKKLADIINLPEDGTGQVLSVHSYPSLIYSRCPTPFQIPKDLETSSIYTVYWLWNTTKSVESGFQIYTACFDIEIMPLELSTGRSRPRTEPLLSLTVTSTHFICPTLQASTADGFLMSHRSSLTGIAGQTPVLNPIQTPRTPSFASFSTSSSSPSSIPRSTHGPSANERTEPTPSIPSTAAGGTFPTSPNSPHMSSAASTHTVKLTSGDIVTFDRKSLNASIGDHVLFKSTNGSFFLFNTTFEDPCFRIRQIENEGQDTVLYEVHTTSPAWFLACNSAETCRCYPPSHFALNPGVHSGQFFDAIKQKSVYFTKTTAQPTWPTTTEIVVVTV